MFDKLKKTIQNIKSPEISGGAKESLNGLITMIKNQDEKDRKLFKGTYVMFMVMFIFYVLLFVINPDPHLLLTQRIGGGFFILSIGIMIPIMQQNYYKRKGVDYQASTIDFLGKAEKRLRFWNKQSYLLIPFILFIDVGECLSLFNASWLSGISPFERILVINIVYFSVLGIALIFARRKWKNEKEQLLHGVRELQSAIAQ